MTRSRICQPFRLDGFRQTKGNVAVFRVEGEIPQSLIDEVTGSSSFLRIEGDMVIARNWGSSLHAEEVPDRLVRTHSSDTFSVMSVLEVFTELSPCGPDSKNCRSLLNLYRNNLPVYYAEGWFGADNFYGNILPRLFEAGVPTVIRKGG